MLSPALALALAALLALRARRPVLLGRGTRTDRRLRLGHGHARTIPPVAAAAVSGGAGAVGSVGATAAAPTAAGCLAPATSGSVFWTTLSSGNTGT